MKISFIITSLNCGGAERVVSALASELIKRHEISIILLSDDPIFYPLDPSIRLIQLDLYKPTHSFKDKLFSNFHRIYTLYNTIKKENSDVFVSFMTQTNILSIISAKLANKKIIVSERSDYNFLQNRYWRIFRRVFYPLANKIILQSHQEAQFYKNAAVIANPITIQCPTLDKEKIILAVGRLDENKGFDRLIKACRNLPSEWKVVIIGEGAQKDTLQSLINSLHINALILPYTSNIAQYYAKASIFVLSSHKEGMPNVLLEAMACGCACICFEYSKAIYEIIDTNNGIVVKNIEELAVQLSNLISNPAKMHTLQQHAQQIKHRYNTHTISTQWEKVICDID
ncbi:MAG: glycosyltransferase family 4 protein [Epsilonproteobacteria bacterium]|nr:glycosyltransferase family 4 protein [Campylobacterota bacterium]